LQLGPDIAEDLDVSVTRMFRSLEVGITVLKGKVQGCVPVPGQQSRGAVAGRTNPVRVLLQLMYHRSPHQNPNFRTREKITLIVVHQTAGSTNIGGTLTWFEKQQAEPKDKVSSNYVISAGAHASRNGADEPCFATGGSISQTPSKSSPRPNVPEARH
jgi:hypothetical protein